MKTPTGKLRKTRGAPIEKGGQGNASASPHNIRLDLLRKQFHLSIDINQPPKNELNDQYNFKLMNGHGSGSSSNKSLKAQKSTTSRISLPSSSQVPDYLSPILASDLGGTAKDELPSLIVRGCPRCHMFVMVSKAVPRCPRCKNNRMLVVDKIRGNRAKKLRKSRI